MPNEELSNTEDVETVSEAESENTTADNRDKGEEHDVVDNSLLDVKSSGRSSGYGAIQRHLEKIEDRQRRLSRCMSPAATCMLMAAEVEEGKSGMGGFWSKLLKH